MAHVEQLLEPSQSLGENLVEFCLRADPDPVEYTYGSVCHTANANTQHSLPTRHHRIPEGGAVSRLNYVDGSNQAGRRGT